MSRETAPDRVFCEIAKSPDFNGYQRGIFDKKREKSGKRIKMFKYLKIEVGFNEVGFLWKIYSGEKDEKSAMTNLKNDYSFRMEQQTLVELL